MHYFKNIVRITDTDVGFGEKNSLKIEAETSKPALLCLFLHLILYNMHIQFEIEHKCNVIIYCVLIRKF